MFKFGGAKDVVTLFHKPASSTSSRFLQLLKDASAAATAASTSETVTSQSGKLLSTQRPPFEVEVSEGPPTPDQLQTLLSYVPPGTVSEFVRGAKNGPEALKRFREDSNNFERPVIVDWVNGKACSSASNESVILSMLKVDFKSAQ